MERRITALRHTLMGSLLAILLALGMFAPRARAAEGPCRGGWRGPHKESELRACIAEEQAETESRERTEREAEIKSAQEREAHEQYEREAPMRRAAEEVAKMSHEEQIAAAEERADEEASVTGLVVRAIPHRSHRADAPGYTSFIVTTMPRNFGSQVSVELRLGHRIYRNSQFGYELHVSWPSCERHPNGFIVYYIVRAKPARGASTWSITRRGRFTIGSENRCRWLNRLAAEELARSVAEYNRRVKREMHEAKEEVSRYDYNCHAEGGTPITLHTQAGNELACRASGGGLLSVPR